MAKTKKQEAAELLAHYLAFGLPHSPSSDFYVEVDQIVQAIIDATIDEVRRQIKEGQR